MAAVACDIHPLHGVRVVKRLQRDFDATEAQRLDWSRQWITLGLEAIEATLSRSADTGAYCHGDAPSLADVFLVPQVASARALDVSLESFPTIGRINELCLRHPAFVAALPQNQPDAPA
jgi:maleylacetoacetate isomerase